MNLFNNICLITAVDIEFNAAARLFDRPEIQNIDGFRICRATTRSGDVTLFQSGMGAAGFPDFLKHRLPAEGFSALIVAGLAGALTLTLKRCSAIVYDRCVDGRCDASPRTGIKSSPLRDQNESIHCDDNISSFLCARLIKKEIHCERGSGITLDRILTSAEEKLRLGAQAQAVDMETFDILRVAQSFNLPASAVRIISDEADQDLPDFNRAVDARGRMNSRILLREMLCKPAASARFLVGIKSVSASLRAAMDAILNP